MLRTSILLVAAVCAVAAQQYPSSGVAAGDYYTLGPNHPHPGANSYTPTDQPDYPSTPVSTRDVTAQLGEAATNIAILGSKNKFTNTKLDALQTQINLATYFKKEFQKEIYPAIEANLKSQENRISFLKEQLKNLSSLSSAIEQLDDQLRKLVCAVNKIREGRTAIVSAISKLFNVDLDQNLQVSVVAAQVTGNATGGTATLTDKSKGWTSFLIAVRITAFPVATHRSLTNMTMPIRD